MPMSAPWGKDWVINSVKTVVSKYPVSTVTDVGPGNGTYSRLLRVENEILTWARWRGIEAWGPYVETYGLREIYDEIIVADVRYVVPKNLEADFVIFGDVLEHMGLYSALTLVKKAMLQPRPGADHMILICSPVFHMHQEAVNGNPFECHDDFNYFSPEKADKFFSDLGVAGAGYRLDTHIGDVVGYFLLRKGRYAEVDLSATSES